MDSVSTTDKTRSYHNTPHKGKTLDFSEDKLDDVFGDHEKHKFGETISFDVLHEDHNIFDSGSQEAVVEMDEGKENEDQDQDFDDEDDEDLKWEMEERKVLDPSKMEGDGKDSLLLQIDQHVEGVLVKGEKKKMSRKKRLEMAKRKMEKKEQMEYSKFYVHLQFMRVIIASLTAYNPILQSCLLSRLPIDFKPKKLEISFVNYISDLFMDFETRFGRYRSDAENTLFTKGMNTLIDKMGKKDYVFRMTSIEFLMLFVAYLELHGVRSRMLFMIDTYTLEHEGFIKIKRGRSVSKKNDIVNKQLKRTIGEVLKESIRRRAIEDDSEDEYSEVEKSTKRKKWGEEDALINLEREYSFNSFSTPPKESTEGKTKKKAKSDEKKSGLNKLEKRRITRSQTSKSQDTSTTIDTSISKKKRATKKKGAASKKSASYKKKKPEKKEPYRLIDPSPYIWLEVYDARKSKWQVFDLEGKKIPESRDTRIARLQSMKNIYVLAASKCEFDQEKFTQMDYTIFYKEVSVLYSTQSSLKEFLKAKYSCFLDQMIGTFTGRFGTCLPKLATGDFENIEKVENREIDMREQQYLPETSNEFYWSKKYVLESNLRKYQGFLPNTKPVGDFKEDKIYLRRQIIELHTKEKWKRLGRQVKSQEKPIKTVIGLYNDADRKADLYGYWQTKEFKNVLTEEGGLPKNEYGNFELFNGDPPATTCVVDLPMVTVLCKKLGIEFVKVVTGFDRGGGRSFPVYGGILIFEKDRQVIFDAHREFERKRAERQEEKRKKSARTIWKQLIKKILVKKFIAKEYESQNL